MVSQPFMTKDKVLGEKNWKKIDHVKEKLYHYTIYKLSLILMF